MSNENISKKDMLKEEFIIRKTNLNDIFIISRIKDNYFNATKFCEDCGTKFTDWLKLDDTKQIMMLVKMKTKIPVSKLVQRDNDYWVHPELAIQVAQWISRKFYYTSLYEDL